MCDYSLANVPNRLAVEGEQLVLHRFSGGSIGLTSPAELARGADSFWSVLKRSFDLPRTEPVCAVCIPPGARLLLRDVPEHLQRRLDIAPEEEVTFVQRSTEAYYYRDAVRFQNGREILLQSLATGQRVDVLCLSPGDFDEAAHQRLEEEYRRIFMACDLQDQLK